MATDAFLAGRYRLASRLGEGGMGIVWRAWDGLLGREVAVKEVRLPSAMSPAARRELCERTVREARAAGGLAHPSIITVHDVILEDDRPWIVMDLVAGPSLERLAEGGGRLPPDRVARIGLQLLDALGLAHRRGVLHRDVKPANVLLARDDLAILTDFGIAVRSGDTALTSADALVGSPGYMAPERIRDDGGAGPPSDLWSLAATLYAAVEGAGPFQRPHHLAALGAVLTEPAPPPRHAGPLGPALLAALEKDPLRRPTPDAFRHALEAVASPGGTLGRPAPSGTWTTHPPPPLDRRSLTDSQAPGSNGPSLAGEGDGGAWKRPGVAGSTQPRSGTDRAGAHGWGTAPTGVPGGGLQRGGTRARGRVVPAVFAAVTALAVGGALLWAATGGPGPGTAAPPHATGSVATESPGDGGSPTPGGRHGDARGTAAPVARLDPCALLTDAQAGELLAGSPKPDGKACVWQDTATVKIKATGYPGDATAKDTMALYRRQAASDAGDSEDVMTTTGSSAVRAVPGLGDEAFAQDTGTASEFGDSATTVVWARKGRYVLQIDYRMPGRPEVTDVVRARAAGATRHALANLP